LFTEERYIWRNASAASSVCLLFQSLFLSGRAESINENSSLMLSSACSRVTFILSLGPLGQDLIVGICLFVPRNTPAANDCGSSRAHTFYSWSYFQPLSVSGAAFIVDFIVLFSE
jgi:hypothetical protein